MEGMKVEQSYQCRFCEKHHSRKDVLEIHERTHTGAKPYKCKSCDKCFRQKRQMKIHERVHSGERPYQCVFCTRSFAQKVTLTRHTLIHFHEKPFQCQFCNDTFIRKEILQKHEIAHNGDYPVKCKFCDAHFGSLYVKALRNHEKRHKGLAEATQDNRKALKSPQTESKCIGQQSHLVPSPIEEGHASFKPLPWHENGSQSKKRHECKVCKKTFLLTKTLRCHESKHTKENAPPNTMKKSEGLPSVQNQFSTQDFTIEKNLPLPLVQLPAKENTTAETLYECDVCFKPFRHINAMQRHAKSHSRKRRHRCKLCKKAFYRSCGLKSHEKTHNKVKDLSSTSPLPSTMEIKDALKCDWVLAPGAGLILDVDLDLIPLNFE